MYVLSIIGTCIVPKWIPIRIVRKDYAETVSYPVLLVQKGAVSWAPRGDMYTLRQIQLRSFVVSLFKPANSCRQGVCRILAFALFPLLAHTRGQARITQDLVDGIQFPTAVHVFPNEEFCEPNKIWTNSALLVATAKITAGLLTLHCATWRISSWKSFSPRCVEVRWGLEGITISLV